MGATDERARTVTPQADTIIDPRAGTIIGGRYRILTRLGEGASGTVYLAEHMGIGKQVALKLMRMHNAMDGALLARFNREAKAASVVAHPGIVEVTDSGETDDHLPFIVMEFIDGSSLSELVGRGAPPSPAMGRKLTLQIAEALTAAHEKGIIHRDLKPENLLLCADGETVKVADFGLCRWYPGDGDTKLTMDGQILGTPHYMSPEQIRGVEVDDKCDVYALGCILFELLTGHVLYQYDAIIDVMNAHLNEVAPRAAEHAPGPIPADLDEIVSACLRKEAEDRPTMREALEMLRDSEAGRPSVLVGEGAARRGGRRAKVAVGLALGALAATAIWASLGPESPAPSAKTASATAWAVLVNPLAPAVPELLAPLGAKLKGKAAAAAATEVKPEPRKAAKKPAKARRRRPARAKKPAPKPVVVAATMAAAASKPKPAAPKPQPVDLKPF